jgi:hypothetical protein
VTAGRDARPARRTTCLILAEPEDEAAAWLAAGLAASGLHTDLVTTEQLCDAAALEHRLGGTSATFRITLNDGRALDSRAIGAVVNRMARVPMSVLARSEAPDRTYVEAEWRALLCSLLVAIPGPVIDSPHPHALAGQWRSPPEWLRLAHEAGLRTPAWRWSGRNANPSVDLDANREPLRVLMVGGEAVSPRALPDATAAVCRRLADLVGVSVLGLELVEARGAVASDGPPTFAAADQLPDLRDGGDAAVAAYARLLRA